MVYDLSKDPAINGIILNMKNLNRRVGTGVNFKEQAEKQRRRLLRRLDMNFTGLDERKVHATIEDLIRLYNEQIIKSIDFILRMLNHHISRIESYLPGLPNNELTGKARYCISLYKSISHVIDGKLRSIILQEMKMLEQMKQHYGIRPYRIFKDLYKQETDLMDTLWIDTEIRLRPFYKISKKLTKAKSKYSQIKEDHPQAVIVFELVIAFGGGLEAFFVARRVRILFNLFSRAANKVGMMYYISDWTERFYESRMARSLA